MTGLVQPYNTDMDKLVYNDPRFVSEYRNLSGNIHSILPETRTPVTKFQVCVCVLVGRGGGGFISRGRGVEALAFQSLLNSDKGVGSTPFSVREFKDSPASKHSPLILIGYKAIST